MEELPDEQLIHVLRSATTMTGISTYLKALLTESADRLERHRDDAMKIKKRKEAN